MSAREPLARFVETQLGPTDMVGVMYPLETVASVRMTRNHEAISQGLRQFLGRKFDYTPMNPAENQYANYPAQTVEEIRNQVSLSALRSLIVHLGSLKEGRKSLILVSEGYSSLLPPQLSRSDRVDARLRESATAGIPTRATATRRRSSASVDMLSDLREIYSNANHYNVSIYAVDPRGLDQLRVRHQRGRRPQHRTSNTSTRRWTRCACWRIRPTAARSSTATISKAG